MVLILLCDKGAKCQISTTGPIRVNKGSWKIGTRYPPARAGSETWNLTASRGRVGIIPYPFD